MCSFLAVDLFDVNLDEVVSIERGRISLYPTTHDSARCLPPPGHGLNQPALVTFRRMAVRQPSDKRIVDAFRKKLEEAATRMQGVFVHYDQDKGIWLLKLDAWM